MTSFSSLMVFRRLLSEKRVGRSLQTSLLLNSDPSGESWVQQGRDDPTHHARIHQDRDCLFSHSAASNPAEIGRRDSVVPTSRLALDCAQNRVASERVLFAVVVVLQLVSLVHPARACVTSSSEFISHSFYPSLRDAGGFGHFIRLPPSRSVPRKRKNNLQSHFQPRFGNFQ